MSKSSTKNSILKKESIKPSKSLTPMEVKFLRFGFSHYDEVTSLEDNGFVVRATSSELSSLLEVPPELVHKTSIALFKSLGQNESPPVY